MSFGQAIQKEVERSLSNLRSHNVSPDLVKELAQNIELLDQMHAEVTRAPNLATTPPGDLNKRSELDCLDFKSPQQTLADIVDDVASGQAMVSKKIVCGSLAVSLDASKNKSLVLAKKGGSHTWADDERKALYNGLRLFGTDFSMISATILRARSQKEVYKRFQREDKLNPELVNKALRWHLDNKARIQKGFSRVLQALHIDVENFDPLEYSLHSQSIRTDDIKPLEFYLLNPPN
jgi:hypothetical protein